MASLGAGTLQFRREDSVESQVSSTDIDRWPLGKGANAMELAVFSISIGPV